MRGYELIIYEAVLYFYNLCWYLYKLKFELIINCEKVINI